MNNVIIENSKLYKINDNITYNNVDDNINKTNKNLLNKFRKRDNDKKINYNDNRERNISRFNFFLFKLFTWIFVIVIFIFIFAIIIVIIISIISIVLIVFITFIVFFFKFKIDDETFDFNIFNSITMNISFNFFDNYSIIWIIKNNFYLSWKILMNNNQIDD